MTKILAIALATAGALWLSVPAASASTAAPEGIRNGDSVQTDLSSARRHRRYRRSARVYTYPGPTPYGYYGPTYYERPYARPAPFLFGFPSHW